MALGLISSEQIDDYWVQNTRRRVFYAYPNGAAPLTGLLSLMENKDTPLPEFGWNEERWSPIKNIDENWTDCDPRILHSWNDNSPC